MVQPPGIGPNLPDHNSLNNKEVKPVKNIKESQHSSNGQPPQTFAQKAWGFNSQEAKKFLQTLLTTIVNQIKHEQELEKQQSDKLKRAEEGEDD